MRKSNFELLRLFCIFGIVVMHAMGNIDTSLSVWNTESHIFVNALFNTGVTCFILISGYFGIKFRLEKLIEMDFMVIFYTVAGVAVRGDLKAKELILACFPIITRHYWFISCYFALCFLAPLLNALAEKIKKDAEQKLEEKNQQKKAEEEKKQAETKQAENNQTNTEQKNNQTTSKWISPSGNIYIGVKLYYGAGDEKMYVGEVVDISEKVRMANGKTFRGVCLKMYGGSIEWKDRNEIILSGKWYVKSDDPALNN